MDKVRIGQHSVLQEDFLRAFHRLKLNARSTTAACSSPSPDIARFIGARRWCEHSLRSRFAPRPGLVSLRQIFVRRCHTGDSRKQFAHFQARGPENFRKRPNPQGARPVMSAQASLGSCFFVGSHETCPRRRIWGTGISQVVTPQMGSWGTTPLPPPALGERRPEHARKFRRSSIYRAVTGYEK